MSDMPWFQFYPGDWLAGTRGMSVIENGVYITLIAAMYDRRGPIPNDADDIARMCGATKKQLVPALKKLVARGKLIVTDDGIWNTRVESELKSSNARRELNKKAAEARWSSKDKGKQWQGDASASSAQCENDASQKSEVRSQNSLAAEDKTPTAKSVELGQRITDYMGVTNDPRWMGNWSLVAVWLGRGYDGELDIWPTVAAIVDRFKATGRKMPGSLAYFSKAIADNHKRRVESGVAAPAHRPGQEVFLVKRGSKQFVAWIAHFKSIGRRTNFMENMTEMTVPSLFPPELEKAA